MTPRTIIEKKQSGQELTRQEIEYFIDGVSGGEIADYHTAAWLMAVFFKGMTIRETIDLTRAMVQSGRTVDFLGLPGKRVDKHSTGGVGDKLSLLIAPIIAACGGQIPMISGRGLGHTGGTLDKLESLPGFNVKLSTEAIREGVLQNGAVFAGQTDDITPADMKLYALRDVTGTVRSLPLITSSIISKKKAEGIDALVLDVKCGKGAVSSKTAEMEELARWLVDVGNGFGIETIALLTDMNQPLGRTVGNWLEVKECVEFMQTGGGAEDLAALNMALCGIMLRLSGIAPSAVKGCQTAQNALASGKAYQSFLRIAQYQGADISFLGHPEKYPPARFKYDFYAERSGYIQDIDARTVGELALLLGAGRKSKEDAIDYKAGMEFLRKRGDMVEKGQTVAVLYADDKAKLDSILPDFPAVFTYSDSPPEKMPLIRKVLTKEGESSWEEMLNDE